MVTRAEKYAVANALHSKGVPAPAIARTIGCGTPFVATLINASMWPAAVRAAWLLGLNTSKYHN